MLHSSTTPTTLPLLKRYRITITTTLQQQLKDGGTIRQHRRTIQFFLALLLTGQASLYRHRRKKRVRLTDVFNQTSPISKHIHFLSGAARDVIEFGSNQYTLLSDSEVPDIGDGDVDDDLDDDIEEQSSATDYYGESDNDNDAESGRKWTWSAGTKRKFTRPIKFNRRSRKSLHPTGSCTEKREGDADSARAHSNDHRTSTGLTDQAASTVTDPATAREAATCSTLPIVATTSDMPLPVRPSTVPDETQYPYYIHKEDGRREVVEVRAEYNEGEGGGYCIYIPSLNRERHIPNGKLVRHPEEAHSDGDCTSAGLADQPGDFAANCHCSINGDTSKLYILYISYCQT